MSKFVKQFLLMVSCLVTIFMSNEANAVKLTREQAIDGCMNNPMDGANKQSKEYCDCYADNYPAFAKALAEKNPEAVLYLRKCDPLKTRNIENEGELQKSIYVQSCKIGRDPGADRYCECTAEVMKQEYIKFENANLKMTQDALNKTSASEIAKRLDLADEKCKTLEDNKKSSSTNPVTMPQQFEFKDENGKKHILPAPQYTIQ